MLGALVCGCVSVPVVDETLSPTHSPSEVEVVGSRGPLSKRQSKAVLKRLASQSPVVGALERHLAVEQVVAESPLFLGNEVKILRDGSETFPAMFAAIQGAQHYLYLEYYIFEDVSCNGGQLGDLLVERAHAGVHIDVIYDGIGSIGTPSAFFDRLQSEGIHVLQFNPVNPLRTGWRMTLNDRDHRKILIADGQTAIIGGVNLSSTYQSAPSGSSEPAPAGTVWHDLDLQVRGPVVSELERLFREHWREQQSSFEDTVPASGGSPEQGSEIVRILGSAPRRLTSRYYVTVLSAIRNAESTVWISSAYFAPTHQEKEDLIHAARRGVDVRLLLPSQSDSSVVLKVQHSHYTDLLKAGVKIYEREGGILHSKTMVVDQVWSITGSSNFDHRSVLFNDEVDAVVIGHETGTALTQNFESELQHAHAIDLPTWRKRSVWTKVSEHFWRLWEKLL